MKLIKLLTITSMLVLLSTNIAFAKDKKVDWETRRSFLEENITKIGSQGPEKVDEWLAANGVVKANTEEAVGAQSSSGHVSLYGIQGYKDASTANYLIKGWWTWDSATAVDNLAGAVDGVSLAMCQTNWNPVTGYVFTSNPTGIAVYDQYGTNYPSAGNTSSISKSGILYNFDDAWVGTKYVGYKGQVWAWMSTPPSQSTIYIKMDYKHTWTSATLNSIGFSWPLNTAPTLSMSFSPTPSSFQIANQATLYSWPTQ